MNIFHVEMKEKSLYFFTHAFLPYMPELTVNDFFFVFYAPTIPTMVERAYSVTPICLSISVRIGHQQSAFKFFRLGYPFPLNTFLVLSMFPSLHIA